MVPSKLEIMRTTLGVVRVVWSGEAEVRRDGDLGDAMASERHSSLNFSRSA